MDAPYKAHTGLFVQLSLGRLRQSLGQREGAAPGEPTDGDALQGLGWAAPSVSMTSSPAFNPASWRLCAHVDTHRHSHTQAPWGGQVCKPDPRPCG